MERCVEKGTGSAKISVSDLLAFSRKKDFTTLFEAQGKEGTESAEKNLAIGRRILRRIVGELKPREGQLRAGHVRSSLELAESGENGKRLPRPGGHRSAHKLKRLLSKKGLSRPEREGWPILTSRGILVWARGLPVAAEFAATEKTRAGIVITEEAIS